MIKQILKKIVHLLFRVRTSSGPVMVSNIERARRLGVNIGDHCDLVTFPMFASEPYLVEIGDYTTISSDVYFLTHDGATRVIRNLPTGNPETVIYGKIKIGRNCFVGCRSTILPNVIIGDNSIIGACSLVNRDIPSNCVAAGNPCKVICSIDEYRKKNDQKFLYMVSLPVDKKREFLLAHFANDED